MSFIARRSRILPRPSRIRSRSGSEAPNSITAVSRKGERASSACAIDMRSIFTCRSSSRYVSKLSCSSARERARPPRVSARRSQRALERFAVAGQHAIPRRVRVQLGPQQVDEPAREVPVPTKVALDERQRPGIGEALREAQRVLAITRLRQEGQRASRSPEAPARQPLRQRAAVHPQVAAEHLVSPVAVQGDGDLRARQLREQVRRDRRRVAKRPVVVPDQPVHEVERLRLDHELRVLRPEPLRHHARVLALVVVAPACEADRERLHAPARRLGHQRDHGRRIETAREKRAERHVRHQTSRDRALQQLPEALLGRVIVRDLAVPEPHAPVR